MKSLCSITSLTIILFGAHMARAQQPDQPGPEHKQLAKSVGTWDAVVKIDGAPDSKGTMVVQAVNGGLWVASKFTGDLGGAGFEGHGLDGYDQRKKKFVSVWTDSMSSGFMLMEGTFDEKAQAFVMTGEGPGPDGQPMKYKTVNKFSDNDHQTFQMYTVAPGGAETKMMTIEYTRKK